MTAVNIEKVHARLLIKQPLDEYVPILGSRSSSIHYNETQGSRPGGEIGRRKGLKSPIGSVVHSCYLETVRAWRNRQTQRT
jgi:hypothetical protein